MFIRIEEYFLSKPERIICLGRTLAYLGGTLIILALMGNGAKSAIGTIGGIGGRISAAKTLADIYPSLPTWWIPESIVGALPALLMVLAGAMIFQFGKQIKQLMGSI